ncbi:MAG: WYL domain-containing transcriptional regulator [Burkholderiales bacterium]|nr:WYL domain-containing transcriptional regulator [Burkholderiales bacterium]
MSSHADHDTLAHRLTQMLVRLNQGDKLQPHALAQEFNVNLRTIQRDLNERFAYLPLEKTEVGYQLDPSYLGKLHYRDLERFACMAGIQRLYPVLSNEFLRDLLDRRIESALLVKGYNYEDLGDRTHTFQLLEQAILERQTISFRYQKEAGSKSYTEAEPYKLINHCGVWYLACMDGDKLKAFSVSKIDRLLVSNDTFESAPHIEQLLRDEDSIWLNEKKTEVVLKVAKEAAGYFRRRKLIAGQVLEKELEDGGMLVSGKVAHPNQILPIVRYWIPNVQIISPEGLQAELNQQLHTYLEVR